MNVNLYLPEVFSRNAEGLCGNFNCEREDDWTFKNGTECKIGIENANNGYTRTQCELDCQVSFILNPSDNPDTGKNDPDNIGTDCNEQKLDLQHSSV